MRWRKGGFKGDWLSVKLSRYEPRLHAFRPGDRTAGKSLSCANSPAALKDPGLREQMRNSVIQCFKFTYELSWKILKRYLEATEASLAELDTSTFQNLIRLGNERSLLRSDWHQWKVYRQARTDSSHTYDATKAEAVFAMAPDFLVEAKFLFAELDRRGTQDS